MPMIEVRQLGASEPLEFEVTIRDSGSETRHRVTMTMSECRRLAGKDCVPKRCIEAAFRFLLDREPKESILRRFDVAIISSYFPEFAAQLPRYLAADESAR
jgi:hypothetical protein